MPVPVETFACRRVMGELKGLRDDLETRHAISDAASDRLIRLALNEAEALAWSEPFPYLTFAALAEEKVANVRRWQHRQEQLRRAPLGPVTDQPDRDRS